VKSITALAHYVSYINNIHIYTKFTSKLTDPSTIATAHVQSMELPITRQLLVHDLLKIPVQYNKDVLSVQNQ